MSDNKLRAALEELIEESKSHYQWMEHLKPQALDGEFYEAIGKAEVALRESPAAPEGGEQVERRVCPKCKREFDAYGDPECPYCLCPVSHPVAPSLPAKEERRDAWYCKSCGECNSSQTLQCECGNWQDRPVPQPAATGEGAELADLKAIAERINKALHDYDCRMDDGDGERDAQSFIQIIRSIVSEFHAKVKP